MAGVPDARPRYLGITDSEIAARVEALHGQYADCHLCPHECGVDRTSGETGVCGAGETPVVASYAPHFGEEPVLRGQGGSGTIFLGNCPLSCVFCQNFESSQQGRGETATAADIAAMALDLQDRGCHNVNFVTPTHHAPHLVEVIRIARDRGLELPIVWNCGGYERREILAELDGLVDIYLPDVKWSDDAALRYSGAPAYWEAARTALDAMHQQVGDLRVSEGIATGGLLVRHLVMPGQVENAKTILSFLAELSEDTYVNLMGQYRPHYQVRSGTAYPRIDRRVSDDAYRAVLDHAKAVGLDRVASDPGRPAGR